MTGAAPITPEMVGAALMRAGAVMRTAPRGLADEDLEHARAAWTWLAIIRSETGAQIVEFRASTGASWAAIGRLMQRPPADVKRLHRAALVEMADRLTEALEAVP